MQQLKMKYFAWRLRVAEDNIDFCCGLLNRTEEELNEHNHIMYQIYATKRQYYRSRIAIGY